MLIPLFALVAALSVTGCSVNVRINTPAKPDTEDPVEASAVTEKPSPAEAYLRDAVASPDGLGDDAVTGACLSSLSIKDPQVFLLTTKHFNAVTLENELKPDAMFGYSNEACPPGSLHEEELNGEAVTVPALDYSRADAMLDKIMAWNEANPGRQIKVRGHVLVWHSQTPEWFFHVDYDPKKDYVSKEEMDRRLEWYIRSVLEYYTGQDSKYKGLFYGWDVVNEAVSDRTGTYRTDTEPGDDSLTDSVHGSKSSWWKVYGSNEYIINAFRFANLYAPDELDLYYNDYNECDSKKMRGITELIEAVKSADGTRLDGFGMQGHYSVNAPTAQQIEDAAKVYAAAAGKVMLTELDVKDSMFYSGDPEDLPEEYERQAKYYGAIYEALKNLRAEGANIVGISFWGVCDKYTWLQTQHPLLFDEQYNAKPAYYVFTDGLQ